MATPSIELSRRSAICLAGLAGLTGLGPMAIARTAQSTRVDVFRDPSCGCCGRWIEHLRQNGFELNVIETSDLQSIKKSAGVPSNLASCHTAKVGGYVIEGHVPAKAIRRLLEQAPDALGLAVPGMPIGSPGMEGGDPVVYDVILFGQEPQKTFGTFKGQEQQ